MSLIDRASRPISSVRDGRRGTPLLLHQRLQFLEPVLDPDEVVGVIGFSMRNRSPAAVTSYLALNDLHDQCLDAGGVLQPEDGRDVGMIQRRQRLCRGHG